jgi:hypothetical protein
MSDPFRKVRPGDALNVSATAWNAVIDAAKAEADRRFGADAGDLTTGRSGSIVRVKNETGGALDRAHVVGLGGPIFGPDDSLDAFLREVTFRGVVPTSSHVDRFAVLLEPAPVNRVVRAYVAGVCPVRVDVTDGTHTTAAADVGETALLVSAAAGPAQILWSEGGTGEQWALIQFGTTCGITEEYYGD